MGTYSTALKTRLRWRRSRWVVAILATLWCAAASAQDRLVDREPFDRILLDSANDNRSLDVLPLTFPDGRLPDPFPKSGTLRVVLVDYPLQEFEVKWANIKEIRLFAQLVLDEAEQLARGGRFRQAYEYLSYLQRYHADLPGLFPAMENVLELEVARSYAQGAFEQSWMVLNTLIDRNPKHPGINRALSNVASGLLERQIATSDFRSARHYVGLLEDRFGEVGRTIADRWRERLRGMAAQRVQEARAHFASGRIDEARSGVRAALAIEPGLDEALRLARQIAIARPRIIVAVVAEAAPTLTRRLDDWAARRIEPLVDPPLVELRGFSADGGEYRSPYGELLRESSGSTTLVLSPKADRDSLTAYTLARRLVTLARSSQGELGTLLARQLSEIAVNGTQAVQIKWRYPHVRPEALLGIGLNDEVRLDVESGAAAGQSEQERSAGRPLESNPLGPFQFKRRTLEEVSFARQTPASAPEGAAEIDAKVPVQEIVERTFASEDEAVAALLRGEVDMVERISPTHVPRLTTQDGIIVSQYALPTVHVLVPSAENRLMAIPELRRALVYGVDRQSVVNELLISDGPRDSAVAISGPLPPGNSFTDPIGYAYDRAIEPRAYDPRLAATLATVAARLHNPPQPSGRDSQEASAEEVELPELTLAHPSLPLPRAVCQAIAQELEAAGIPIRLAEYLPEDLRDGKLDCDLRYAELAMWEPVVDVYRLLGPRGEVGTCSARMGLALSRLDQARTWQEVREALHEVHRVARDELVVIPLWQTTNYFAYRASIEGVTSQPVTLYHNVANWRIQSDVAARRGMPDAEATTQ
jgi:ABC-type transport system substrate-binding protein